jgi:peptide/nickel transport system permease protein
MNEIWRMIGQRLLLGVLTLFIISVVIFGATELLPGDLARELLGQSATEETLAALREQLGLNDPAVEQHAVSGTLCCRPVCSFVAATGRSGGPLAQLDL